MNKLFKYIRLKDWWNFIIPPVISFYCLQLLNKDTSLISINIISIKFIAFLFLSIFVAAFGFFLNEWTDIDDDKIAGKNNALLKLPNWKIILYFSFIVIANFITIIFINWNTFTLLLLTTQYLLFIFYSVYPMRLKRNKYATLIIDALYSGTIFYILAFTLETKTIEINYVQIILLFIWAFTKGIRNIIYHLIQDKKYDDKIQINTIATSTSNTKLLRITKYFLIPFEIIIFTILLYTVPYNYVLVSSYLLFILYIINRKKFIVPIILKRKNEIKINNFTELNLFHEIVLPLISLILLIVNDKRFIVLLLFCLLLNKIVNYRISILNTKKN